MLLLFLSTLQLKLQSPELVLSDTTVIKLLENDKKTVLPNTFAFSTVNLEK